MIYVNIDTGIRHSAPTAQSKEMYNLVARVLERSQWWLTIPAGTRLVDTGALRSSTYLRDHCDVPQVAAEQRYAPLKTQRELIDERLEQRSK